MADENSNTSPSLNNSAIDPLADTVTITVDGEDFEFTIPSIFDEMKVGMRMRDIRRRVAGTNGDYSDVGLDQTTLFFNRACATFELFLKRASVTWPFTKGAGGPVIDCEKFPKNKAATVIAVYEALQLKLLTFREGGVATQQPNPEQAMGSSEASGQQGGGESV